LSFVSNLADSTSHLGYYHLDLPQTDLKQMGGTFTRLFILLQSPPISPSRYLYCSLVLTGGRVHGKNIPAHLLTPYDKVPQSFFVMRDQMEVCSVSGERMLPSFLATHSLSALLLGDIRFFHPPLPAPPWAFLTVGLPPLGDDSTLFRRGYGFTVFRVSNLCGLGSVCSPVAQCPRNPSR
jgi:hypothetical protein